MTTSATTTPTLDGLIGSDPIVRQIVAQQRSGVGCSLDEAVRRVKELFEGMPDRLAAVDTAAESIRDLTRRTFELNDPRGLVVRGRNSWYPGPRHDDRHWPKLRLLLEQEGWDEGSLDSLDAASTKIVAHLADPHETVFERKGLVLGYVQSGKTTNFTAVIAKAADAGYRFFIVLSGMHNALRAQTQDRLDGQLRFPLRGHWTPLTRGTAEEPEVHEHDFEITAADPEAALAGEQLVLAVVKKNGPRLRKLRRWLQSAHPETLARCPVMVIDDEADQATPNTARPDRNPTVINGLIRQILADLPRVAYVGYTATPFANVLIDPGLPDDLYPRDFIIDLPRPVEYVGPETLFGREPLEFDGTGELSEDGADLIRRVDEDEIEDLKPKGPADRFDFIPSITPSLGDAVRYFLLSTAARRTRGVGNRHATMLVHTSQFTVVHQVMSEALRQHVRGLAERLAQGDDELLDELRTQWEEECAAVPAADFGHARLAFDDLRPRLLAVCRDLEVIQDNSNSHDRLSYGRQPRTIIAVGGNTLSRGLTLEGLSVSLFVRSATAYDTLLQMGRWFGYRPGYADLTRIWMTEEMREWFRHLATVEQEIRYDIERYEAEHLTPLELAPRIRTHPKLAITAAAKMQAAVTAEVSYAGRRLQTILFEHRDADWLKTNLDAGTRLVSRVRAEVGEPLSPRGGVSLVRGVPSSLVLEFLSAYCFHQNSRDLEADAISRYIEARMQEGELERFSVAVLGLGQETNGLGTLDLGFGAVGCINRARLAHVDRTYADIKSLMSRPDRVVDLGLEPAEVAAMGPADLATIRSAPPAGRGDGSGLLALYPISKDSRPDRGRTRVPLDAVEHVLGVGLVFPTSRVEETGVEYRTVDLSRVEREVPADEDVTDLDETEREDDA